MTSLVNLQDDESLQSILFENLETLQKAAATAAFSGNPELLRRLDLAQQNILQLKRISQEYGSPELLMQAFQPFDPVAPSAPPCPVPDVEPEEGSSEEPIGDSTTSEDKAA